MNSLGFSHHFIPSCAAYIFAPLSLHNVIRIMIDEAVALILIGTGSPSDLLSRSYHFSPKGETSVCRGQNYFWGEGTSMFHLTKVANFFGGSPSKERAFRRPRVNACKGGDQRELSTYDWPPQIDNHPFRKKILAPFMS